jgi:thiamine biosynthesis lipoprotein
MGTRFELVIEDDPAARIRGAAEAALEAIDECHTRFSRFIPESLVAHLARIPAGTAVRLDRDTFGVFADAIAVWRASGGVFDISGGRGAMDALRLDTGHQTITLEQPGLLLDLGAIAKGHALDCAAGLLRNAGVQSAFLHGGTSSAVALGARGWQVALPGGSVIRLQDAALGLSRTGHDTPHPTFDPATGMAVETERCVAVIGSSARLCDAWATAAAIVGYRPEGMPSEYDLRAAGSPSHFTHHLSPPCLPAAAF